MSVGLVLNVPGVICALNVADIGSCIYVELSYRSIFESGICPRLSQKVATRMTNIDPNNNSPFKTAGHNCLY